MKGKKEGKRQWEILHRGLAESLPEDGLRRKLESSVTEGRPLRVKLGIDPTARDVHIGHMVPYRKLREFQDLGHTAVLIIGDFTATIGDPTGKDKERPRLTLEEARRNAETYCSQIFKVIDETKAEVRYQSSWFEGKTLRDAIGMAGEMSVSHLLSHETFRARLDKGARLSLHELFYPLLQAWDSLEVEADIEIGGLDQKFNILCGRDLQRHCGVEPQTGLFVPLLPGTDGRKMSKSTGNSIAVTTPPEQMYGKVMSIPDTLSDTYVRLACSPGKEFSSDPYTRKRQIARNITEIYHGLPAAEQGEGYFLRTISRKEIPSDLPEAALRAGTYPLVPFLAEQKLCSSRSDARRLVSQGGVRIGGTKIQDPDSCLSLQAGEEMVLQAGKRRYLKIRGLPPMS